MNVATDHGKRDRLRVGIVGIGWFAERYHVPNLKSTGRAEIVAVCRRNSDRLEQARVRIGAHHASTDWREMMEKTELDAVVICTPHDAHPEPAVAALKRGLHVLVEKPMALTTRDAGAMVGASKAAGKTLMVGYICRCLSVWQGIARALEGGAVGRIRQVVMTAASDFRWLWKPELTPSQWREMLSGSTTPGYLTEWQSDGYWRRDAAKMGGGAFSDAGSHAADLALWLSGAAPVEVFALSDKAGLPVDCFLGIQARLANGVLLSLAYAAGVPGGIRSQLTVLGDKGTLHTGFGGIGDVAAQDVWLERDGRRQEIEPVETDRTTDAAFVETVLDGKPNLAPGSEGIRAVAFTEAVYRSLREGAPVQVEPESDKEGDRAHE